jgi:hypothetical protein
MRSAQRGWCNAGASGVPHPPNTPRGLIRPRGIPLVRTALFYENNLRMPRHAATAAPVRHVRETAPVAQAAPPVVPPAAPSSNRPMTGVGF